MVYDVWVLILGGVDDVKVSLHASQIDARGVIRQYVLTEWNEGAMNDTEMPGDLDDAVIQYFERFEDEEWYRIENQLVYFPDPAYMNAPAPPVAEGEIVELDNLEMQAIIAGLGSLQWKILSERAKITLQDAESVVSSALRKMRD